MSQQIISLGNTTNDGTGDSLRTGAQKINANFSELYAALTTASVKGIVQGAGISVSNTNGVVTITNIAGNSGSFKNIAVPGQSNISAALLSDTLNITSGGNITVTTNTTSNTLNFSLANPVVANLTGNVAGNVTGNLTGNVAGNVAGNLTGNVTATEVDVSTLKITGNAITAQQAMANLQSQIATLNSQYSTLQSEITAAQSTISGLDPVSQAGLIANYYAQISGWQNQETNLQGQIQLLQHQYNTISAGLASPNAAITYDAATLNLNVSTGIIASSFTGAIVPTAPVVFPTYDQTSINALTPSSGAVLYNSSTSQLLVYAAGSWQPLGGHISVDAGTLIGNRLASTVTNSNLTTLGVVTSGTWSATPITNSYLANPNVTINGTTIALGASGSITVPASAITGNTLPTTLTNSSLNTVGTLSSLNVATNINAATISLTTGLSMGGVALIDNHGNWLGPTAGLVGGQGPQGATGAKGDTGASGTITLGTVTTLASGSQVQITNSGTPSAAVFNFSIPQGAKGDPGDTIIGPAGTISVGTVTQGIPGSTPSITNSGTSTAAVLNFVIPQGNVGPTGTGVVYGVITLWYGDVNAVPAHWALCDGTNGTPDLRDKFIVGAGRSYSVGETGGSADTTLPYHTHSITDPGHHHEDPYAEGGVPFPVVPNTYGAAGSSATDNDQSRYYTGMALTGITATDAAGSSPTGANLPPYKALCYIMFVG